MASANDLMQAIKTRLETARDTNGLAIGVVIIEGQLSQVGVGAVDIGISCAQDNTLNGVYNWVSARIEIQVGGVREGVNNYEINVIAEQILTILYDWYELQSVYSFTSTGFPAIASAVRAESGYKTIISAVYQYQQEEAVY